MKELLAIYNQFQTNEKRGLVVTTLLWTLWSLLRIAIIVITILIVREILAPAQERTTIYYYWGALIGVFILKGVTFSGANYIGHLAGFALVGRLRRNFIEHLKALSLGFFTKERLGNIATIAHSDINKIELSASHLWTKLVSDLLVSVVVAAGLFIVDWRLGIALISLLPPALLILWRASAKGVAMQKENRDNMADMVSSFVEYTKGIPVLKTFSENPVIFQSLQETIAAFGRSSKRAAVFTSKHIGGYFFFMELCFGVVVAAGAYLFLGDAIPLYVYVIFIMLGREFYKPFVSAEVYLIYYVMLRDSYHRIEAVMQTPAIRATANALVPKKHDIHFDRVSFNYDENGFTMKDIDFKIGEGTITAL
ncbi:ABC transporter ATP-binding protein/permease, partial [Dehalococcoidia bacterium]|nr:ABC transporter ATP-binding protein/permease [Dehalococcoidia bacterium]